MLQLFTLYQHIVLHALSVRLNLVFREQPSLPGALLSFLAATNYSYTRNVRNSQ